MFTRTMWLVSSLVFFALVLAGCGKDSPSFSTLPTGQSFKQSSSIFNNQLDILWVVDNSGSMDPLQNNMVSNFNSFISSFQAKGYDFRMAVTTTEAYKADPRLNGFSSANSGLSKFRDGTDATSHTGVFVILPGTPNLNNVFVTNATQGSAGSGDERAFSSMMEALGAPSNAGFLRPQSFFAIIILSDEDDFSSWNRVENSWGYQSSNPLYVADHNYSYSHLDSVASYESSLDQLTQSSGAFRRYNVSALTVIDNNCLSQHQSQSPSTIVGQRYIQMANDTNGVLGSICDSSYASTLNAIQAHISELSTQFFLSKLPIVSSITVQVNGVMIANDATNGWTYNSTANSIVFHGNSIPAQGSNIAVNFVPQSPG